MGSNKFFFTLKVFKYILVSVLIKICFKIYINFYNLKGRMFSRRKKKQYKYQGLAVYNCFKIF